MGEETGRTSLSSSHPKTSQRTRANRSRARCDWTENQHPLKIKTGLLISLSLSAGSSLVSALVTRGYPTGRHEDKLAAFDAQVTGFQPSEDNLRTQEELVGTWRERLDEAESQAEVSIAKLDQEHAERIEAQESSLLMASGEADDQRQAVLNKLSTFQEAQKMLEAMRPMLEGLASTLKEDEKK